MILTIYVYKGAQTTLVGPWIVAGFLINDKKEQKESSAPHKKSIFKYRKTLDNFNYLFGNNLNIVSIPSWKINIEGDYAIKEAILKLKAFSKAKALEKQDTLIINVITNANLWYERLTIIAAVFFRNEYLLRLSQNKINYFILEHKLNEHLELITNYKYLPPIYILDKCIYYSQNIYPKPAWWVNEFNHLKKY